MSENFPKQPEEKPAEPEKEKPESGMLAEGERVDSFVKLVETSLRLSFKEIIVNGTENLELIPPNRRVIFAPTHLSDSDVPLTISAVGKRFHVAVGDASTHHKFSENTPAWLANQITGPENFYPIKHQKDEKGVERGSINPEDFETMQKPLEERKAMILAAYFKGGHGWELPSKGGYGAVYLAEIANALIVPVAVNIKSKEQVGMGGGGALKTLLKRPNAEVNIGKPLDLPKIEGMERMAEILKKKKTTKLSTEEVQEFHRLSKALREHSDTLMEHLANLLPKEKQGPWKAEDERKTDKDML